jgi:tetratricopeptide (TPR) repeat protein
MKRAPAVTAVLLMSVTGIAVESALASGRQTSNSVDGSLVAGRAALRQKHYAEAIRVLQDGLKRFPGDRRLRVELGRAYLYDRQYDRGVALFREVLREDSSNRLAKLELARVLGYRRDYEASNQLYRELLQVNPGDEAASAGLVRNLIHQKRMAEAQRELDLALARHPNSPRLEKVKNRLNKKKGKMRGGDELGRVRARNQVEGGGQCFSDSAGNRFWRASQQFDYTITPGFSNRFRVEERRLWRGPGPKANVLSGFDELRKQVVPSLSVGGGGGFVHFADGKSRGLYRGALEWKPAPQLRVDAAFSRFPILPTFRAAQFDMLAEGWQTRLDWRPGPWRLTADVSRQHYSDGNRRQREGAELQHWQGSPLLAFGTGYRVNYFTFNQHFLHGYFNPRQYQSHMGLAGVRFRVGKSFRGEYLARAGAESFSPGDSVSRGPYRFAWEVVLRNRAVLGNWEVGGDYFYFRVAQATGAFRAQAGHLVVAYRF